MWSTFGVPGTCSGVSWWIVSCSKNCKGRSIDRGYLPAVANNDLGRVLVRHHHSGAGQSASVGQRVVGLKRLPGHARVKTGSYLKHISTTVKIWNLLGNWGGFSWLESTNIHRSGVWVCERKGNGCSIFHQYSWAGSNSSVLEVLVAVGCLICVEFPHPIVVFMNLSLSCVHLSFLLI